MSCGVFGVRMASGKTAIVGSWGRDLRLSATRASMMSQRSGSVLTQRSGTSFTSGSRRGTLLDPFLDDTASRQLSVFSPDGELIVDVSSDVLEEIPQGLRRMGFGLGVINTILLVWNTTTMPFAFASMGWIPAFAVSVYTIGTLWYSAILLQRICSRMPHLGSYGEVAYAAGGDHLLRAVFGIQSVSYFLLGALNIDLSSQYLQLSFAGVESTLNGFAHCQQTWLLMVFAGFLVLAQIPTFSEMSWVTSASVVSLLITQVVVFYNFGVFPREEDGAGAQEHPYTGQSFSQVVGGFANLAFAYSLHSSLPEQMREYKHPTTFNRVLHFVFILAGIVYTGTGAWGFWLLGVAPQPRGSVSGNIFQNFSPTSAATVIGNVVSFVAITGGCVINNILLFMNLELRLGINPQKWLDEKRWGMPPVFWRVVIRSTLLSLQLLLAQALGDNVGDLQGLVGAVMSSSMAFGFPFLFFWLLFPQEMNGPRKLLFALQMIVAIFVCVAGMYGSITNLANDLQNFVAFRWCGAVCDTARVPGCPVTNSSHFH